MLFYELFESPLSVSQISVSQQEIVHDLNNIFRDTFKFICKFEEFDIVRSDNGQYICFKLVMNDKDVGVIFIDSKPNAP